MTRADTGALGLILREAQALRRQSMLLHRALAPRHVAMHPSSDDLDVVFLLHGVLATAGVFGPLEERLRLAGVRHVASFTFHPFRTIESLAADVASAMRRIPPYARVHLVGHSLGGVVARWYVQEAGGHTRVCQTVSLASPFHGTKLARFVPTALSRELSPDSPLLARLRAGAAHCDVPHTSFVAGDDVIVSPRDSAAFPGGETIVVPGIGHNALLFDDSVADAVSVRIARARAGPRRAA